MIDDSQLVATLLEEGLADQATLDRGLEATAQSGKSLYESLISGQLVKEPDLLGLVARLLDVPSRDIDPEKITNEIHSLVPASMAHRNRVMPLERNAKGELLLAMADPADSLAMDEIAMHTGVVVLPVLVSPAALKAALSSIYPTTDGSSEVAAAVMDAFDDFEVGDYMDDVIPGEEWSDFFDEAANDEVEDSTVLSRDMQDRPSTDVLAAEDVDAAIEAADEDDLPEIEIIEELGQPIRRRPPSPYASLDKWDVDGAIEGGSKILSAGTAEDLFGGSDAPAEALIEEVDETSNLDVAAEISESHTDALETSSSRTSVGVGVEHVAAEAGAGHARPRKKKRVTVENTGKTSLGLPRDEAGDDEEEDEELDDDTHSKGPKEVAPAAARPVRRDSESTDYGALGRAILKSGPTKEEKEALAREDAESEAAGEGSDVADDQTNITAGDKLKDEERPTNPRGLDAAPEAVATLPDPASHDDEDEDEYEDEDDEHGEGERKSNTSIVVALFEDDDVPAAVKPRTPIPAPRSTPTRPTEPQALPPRELVKKPEVRADAERRVEDPSVEPDAGTRPRLSTPVPLNLPDEVDARGLALALANLLVNKGILTADEVAALARSLTKKP